MISLQLNQLYFQEDDLVGWTVDNWLQLNICTWLESAGDDPPPMIDCVTFAF